MGDAGWGYGSHLPVYFLRKFYLEMKTYPLSLTEVAEDPHSTLPKAPGFLVKGRSIKGNAGLRFLFVL